MPLGKRRPRRVEGRQERGPGDGHGHRSRRRCPAGRQARLRGQLDRLGQEPGRRAAVPHAADGSAPPRSIRPRIAASTPSPRARSPLGGPDASPTTGRIHGGCRLEEDFYNVFTKDGKITLVLDKNHADFQVAQDIAELINSQMTFQSQRLPLAQAINQVNIEVTIPAQYRDDPVLFVSQVLSLSDDWSRRPSPRVVDQRADRQHRHQRRRGDRRGGRDAQEHHRRDRRRQGRQAVRAARPRSDADASSLKALVESLNAIHVPPEDIIDIIKGLDRNGKLHAQLVIQ